MTVTKQTVNFFIIFSILIFLYLWDGFLTGNEAQTLANVYNFAHPDWLANDWFLSLDTVYRIPFNIFLFPLAKIFSLPVLAFTSRIVLILLMSFSLTYLFKEIKLSPGSIALFTVIAFRMKGMLAGEDMLWHVEAKVLSYILIVGGITSLLKNEHRRMWLFFGGAAAFHPLVGGYSVIALLFSLMFFKKKETLEIIKTSPFFALSGWPGIGIIIYNLLSSRGASGGVADLIYVARHPHHMIPSDFIRYVHKGIPEWVDYTILIGNLVFCAAILITAFIILDRDSREKRLLYYAAGSFVIFILGLIIYFTGQYHLLKYYIFRFPDVIIPFTAYILFASALDKLFFSRHTKFSILTAVAVISVTGILFGWTTIKLSTRDKPVSTLNETAPKLELYEWIKNETPKDSVFIIDPFTDNFNIAAERAQFATLKHIPQSEKDVLGWYERLKYLNGGKDFYNGKISFDFSGFKDSYFSLTDRELKKIGDLYGQDYYIGPAERQGDLEEVFRNNRWGVYKIREK